MFESDWKSLLRDLSKKTCVLCLGSDLYSLSGEDRFEHRLATNLRQKEDRLGIRVYDDGWFHYKKGGDVYATNGSIEEFYTDHFPNTADDILRKIARLPFNLILNFSPDLKVKAIYEEVRGAGNFAYDRLIRNPGKEKEDQHDTSLKLPPGTPEKPLLYNMLGDYETKDSMVMTYDDFFNYMEHYDKQMPNTIKDGINGATFLIFLGMPIDKWYFHLFMRMIGQRKDITGKRRYSISPWFDESIAANSKEQYFMFFEEKDIHEFLDDLNTRWSDLHGGQDSDGQLSLYDQWRRRIQQPDVDILSLLEEMEPHTQADELHNRMRILLSAQWGVFTSQKFETVRAENSERSQIINGLLNLIQQLENIPQPT